MKKVMLSFGILIFSATLFSGCGNNSKTNSATSSTVQQTQESSKTKKSAETEQMGDFVAKASDATFDGTMLKGNSYSIKITNHKVIQPGEEGNKYGDKPVIAFWFDTLVNPNYDNSTPVSPNTAWITNFEAVQDNDSNKINKLQVASLPDEKYLQDQSAEIKPGGSISSAVAYTLTDSETPVTLTAKNMLGDEFGKADFAIK